MQDAKAFFEQFCGAEHRALVACYTERDPRLFQTALDRVNQFFSKECQLRIGRSEDESWFERGARVVGEGLVPRELFQIKAYAHPALGKLYRAYLSITGRPAPGRSRYASCAFAAPSGAGLEIISWYDEDILPDQGGERFTDNGVSWIYTRGTRLQELGSLIATMKYLPPDDLAHRREFNLE